MNSNEVHSNGAAHEKFDFKNCIFEMRVYSATLIASNTQAHYKWILVFTVLTLKLDCEFILKINADLSLDFL